MKMKLVVWLFVAVVFVWSGCQAGSLTDPAPTSISLTAEKTTAATGEEVEFTVEAAGAALLGIVVTYGDGGVDSVATEGARTATARLTHAYLDVGTYLVTARVVDGVGTSATDELSMEIVPAP